MAFSVEWKVQGNRTLSDFGFKFVTLHGGETQTTTNDQSQKQPEDFMYDRL
jgi:hypothetical protein